MTNAVYDDAASIKWRRMGASDVGTIDIKQGPLSRFQTKHQRLRAPALVQLESLDPSSNRRVSWGRTRVSDHGDSTSLSLLKSDRKSRSDNPRDDGRAVGDLMLSGGRALGEENE